MHKRLKRSILLIVLLIAGLLAGFVGLYRPKTYDNLSPVQEIGLFQNLAYEHGSCTYAVPPSVHSPAQVLLRPMQSWYGKCVLSQKETDALLCAYDWEPQRITAAQWDHSKASKESVLHACPCLFEFDALRTTWTDKTFLVSQTFDDEQDNSHRIGQLFSCFAPDEKTILFYYCAS